MMEIAICIMRIPGLYLRYEQVVRTCILMAKGDQRRAVMQMQTTPVSMLVSYIMYYATSSVGESCGLRRGEASAVKKMRDKIKFRAISTMESRQDDTRWPNNRGRATNTPYTRK